jgi:transcriptional antiterminator
MFIFGYYEIMSTSKVQTREPLNTRQRTILIEFYNQNPYPSASERHQLVQLTGRTLKQIQDWFSNRRVRIHISLKFHLIL